MNGDEASSRIFRFRDLAAVVAVLQFVFILIGYLYGYWNLHRVLIAAEEDRVQIHKDLGVIQAWIFEHSKVTGTYTERVDENRERIRRLEEDVYGRRRR